MHIDLIITNARIWTGDSARPYVSRVGVFQGVVIGVEEELDGVKADTVIDADGAVIVPGFNDVHAHSVWFGQTFLELDLTGVTNGEELLNKIRDYATEMSADEWVIGSNYNPSLIVGGVPSRDALDSATSGRPLWMKHVSGHAYSLNGVGMSSVGVNDFPTETIDGGVIVTDQAGRATGVIEENAMAIVQEYHLPDSISMIEGALEKATSHYLSEGITSVTDAGIAGGWISHSPKEFHAYQRAHETGKLHTRTQTMITLDALHHVPGHQSDPVAHTLDAGIRTGVGDEWLQIGPVKVFTDGSLLGGTAAMTEEYAHCPGNHGYLLADEKELREQVLGAASAGWSLALHAIGDLALDFSIETIVAAQSSFPLPKIPHRIEHGGVVRNDQVEALAKHGIVLVPQPNFISSFGDSMTKNLGTQRADISYPGARLLRAGAVLPGSSDRPVAPGPPLQVMQAFVERLTESGVIYGADDRLTAHEALTAYTHGSAVATGWGDKKGIIRRGMLADFAVLADDPTTVSSDRISQIQVLATLVGGTVSFGSLGDLSR